MGEKKQENKFSRAQEILFQNQGKQTHTRFEKINEGKEKTRP